ncbi:hypothetical protein Dip510_001438 [Elusimicrobium posterum]|uniref:hypothetical protein n=1 Tax=Elusimicrobium posterum TaxID=3116653 RepID=UPI003C715ECC
MNKIQELAPTLTGNFTENEPSEAIWIEYRKKINKFKKTENPLLKKYFFYGLHDSPIISVKKINKKDLEFIVNDGNCLEFACALINKKKLNIDTDKLQFPIKLASMGTKHLSLNIVDCESGKITPCRLRKIDEYLYEEVITFSPGNIEIAFDLWSKNSNPTNRYLLLLACAHLNLTEGQSTAWQKYFGNKYDKYYNHFNQKRENGEYLADYSICEKLIDEIDNF